MSFSQVVKKRSAIVIFLDLKDKAIKEYTIDKDTLNAFFNIYIEKYQSQKERDKAIKIIKIKLETQIVQGYQIFRLVYMK